MKELKCPKCGNTFSVDEADYALLLNQVKNSEFEQELARRIHELERAQQARQEAELASIKAQLSEQKSRSELQLQTMQAQLQQADQQKQIAVMQLRQQATEAYAKKEQELAVLRNQMAEQVKALQDQVAYYKDMKLRLSTKMVGETLEQHCATEFARIRPLFPYAYFEKDNEVVEGTKGDFVFRDSSDDGVEYISIMFEMKNEMDETATKHKNEAFFSELDKDRREKNCEYAVLVSMLEADSELYNAGIVDVSYKYDKMYVVRPQCFIPIITLLRNAAMNSLMYKQELEVIRNQDIDISNFEQSLIKFKDDFGRNYNIAHAHFDKAIEEIDKTIQHLEKVKKELLGSDNQLRIANGKVEDVSIKRLTKDNPTMQAKFEKLKNE